MPKAVTLAVIVVLFIELVLHLVEGRLPEPVTWGSGETSVKVAQVQKISAREGALLDVLITGPSHASIGISPRAMNAVEGCEDLRIYNGGLNGRTYSVVDFVSREVYEPRLRPAVVVLTASPVILNGNNQWMERNSAEFFAAPMPKALQSNSLERRWRLFLSEHVFLFKYRRRGWRLSEGFLNGKKVVDEFGYHPVEGVYDETDRRELLEGSHPYRQIMNRFTFEGPSVEAFLRMISRMQAAGTTVLVVNMPFRDALLEISAKGKDDYRAYLDAMESLRGELGFLWLDYQETMAVGDGDFRDVDHLNTIGAAKVSKELANELLELVPKVSTRSEN